MDKQVNPIIMKNSKDGRMGIRMPKAIIKQYNEMCYSLNSLPSIRIRKFIDIELKSYKQNKDIFKAIE